MEVPQAVIYLAVPKSHITYPVAWLSPIMKNVWPLKLIRGEKLKSYGDEARPSELSTEQITIVAVFVYFIIYRAVRIISSSQCLNF